MLDGCEDVTDKEFEDSVNFTCAIASKCAISKEESQVGCSVYSSKNEFVYGFYNTSDYDDFSSAVYGIQKPARKYYVLSYF